MHASKAKEFFNNSTARRNLRSEKRDTNMGDVVGFKGDFEWNDLLHLRTTSNSPSPTSFPSTYAYIHSVAINHEPAMSDDSEDSIFQKNINVVVGFSAFVVVFCNLTHMFTLLRLHFTLIGWNFTFKSVSEGLFNFIHGKGVQGMSFFRLFHIQRCFKFISKG